jgi:sulfite exporter TauE/SafE
MRERVRRGFAEIALGLGFVFIGAVIPWEALPKVTVAVVGAVLIVVGLWQLSQSDQRKATATLAFVDAQDATVIWTIIRRRQLAQGSNYYKAPLPIVEDRTQTEMDVVRASHREPVPRHDG